jgi:anaerobic ribonucleoside-triphosphate reductase
MFTQQRKGKYLHFPKFQIKVRSDMYRYYYRWILIKKKQIIDEDLKQYIIEIS